MAHWRNRTAWRVVTRWPTATKNHFSRLAGASKHFLADPALACRLLEVDAEALLSRDLRTLKDGTLLGALFEHLVALSVQVYAQANGAAVSHLRTHDGQHEVDLIVRGPGGRVVAIESKLSATPRPADVAQLNWLHERVGDDLAAKVILTAGKDAYTRRDGAAVVPAALLGP